MIRILATPLLACLLGGSFALSPILAASEAEAPGDEDATVAIPRELLTYLNIPLFVEQAPSPELVQLLALSDDEIEQITTAIADTRAGYFDHVLTEIEVEIAANDRFKATIPPLGEAGASYPESLRAWIAGILGQERYELLRLVAQADWHLAMQRRHLAEMRARGFHGEEPGESPQARDARLDADLRARLTQVALSDNLQEANEARIELDCRMTGPGWNGEGSWEVSVSHHVDGRQRGSSRSSGGSLDHDLAHLHALVIERMGVIEPEGDADAEEEAAAGNADGAAVEAQVIELDIPVDEIEP